MGNSRGKEKDLADFDRRIYELVAQIPPGRVTTYGRLALMAGFPGLARRAGRAMARVPTGLPCHRVVNAAGRLAPGFAEQRGRLEAEGVRFKANGCVDMRGFFAR